MEHTSHINQDISHRPHSLWSLIGGLWGVRFTLSGLGALAGPAGPQRLRAVPVQLRGRNSKDPTSSAMKIQGGSEVKVPITTEYTIANVQISSMSCYWYPSQRRSGIKFPCYISMLMRYISRTLMNLATNASRWKITLVPVLMRCS